MIDPGAGQLIAWGGAVAVRATLVLLGAFAISVFLRRSAAVSRHALWTVTLGALLALPVLSSVLPTVPLPLPAGLKVSWEWMAVTPVPGAADPGVSFAGARSVPAPETLPRFGAADAEWDDWRKLGASGDGAGPAAGRTRLEGASKTPEGLGTTPSATSTASADGPPPSRRGALAGFLLLAWLLGAVALTGVPVLGLNRSILLCRRSVEVRENEWLRELRSACATVRLARPVSLRFSPQVRTGMAGGLVHPVVLLPVAARSWSHDRRRIVLLREVVHLKRKDPLRMVCGRIVLALYWFHPFAWCAVRQATLAREEACDEAVVALGHRPSAYARHLLALADPAPHPLPALSRIDRPHLEKRIMKLLATPPRRDRRSVVMASALASLWALTVAAVSPTGQAAPLEEVPTAPGRSPTPFRIRPCLRRSSRLPPRPSTSPPRPSTPSPCPSTLPLCPSRRPRRHRASPHPSPRIPAAV